MNFNALSSDGTKEKYWEQIATFPVFPNKSIENLAVVLHISAYVSRFLEIVEIYDIGSAFRTRFC